MGAKKRWSALRATPSPSTLPSHPCPPLPAQPRKDEAPPVHTAPEVPDVRELLLAVKAGLPLKLAQPKQAHLDQQALHGRQNAGDVVNDVPGF